MSPYRDPPVDWKPAPESTPLPGSTEHVRDVVAACDPRIAKVSVMARPGLAWIFVTAHDYVMAGDLWKVHEAARDALDACLPIGVIPTLSVGYA